MSKALKVLRGIRDASLFIFGVFFQMLIMAILFLLYDSVVMNKFEWFMVAECALLLLFVVGIIVALTLLANHDEKKRTQTEL